MRNDRAFATRGEESRSNVDEGYGQTRQARKTWYYRIDEPGANGKRRQILRRGCRTKGEAERALDVLRRQLDEGTVPAPADDSVLAFRDAWIAALPAEGLEPSTVKHYHEATARLMPNIRGIKLQELTAFDLDEAYGAMRTPGRSERTIRASHVAIKKMLKEAKRHPDDRRERR